MTPRSRNLIAICATASFVAAIAIGSAAVSDGTQEESRGQAEVPVASSASSELQAEARKVFEDFSGSRLQNDASGVLQAWALNAAMDACMADRGFPEWDWSRARNRAPDVDPLQSSVFFAEPLGTPTSETAVAIRARVVAEEDLMADEPGEAEGAAISDCLETTAKTADDDASRASQPAAATPLRQAWWRLMSDLDRRFGNLPNYYACMTEADLSILREQDRQIEDLDEVMSSLIPAARDIPTAADSPAADNPAWQRLLAVEREVADADWNCRADVYHAHVAHVRSAIADFALAHAGQIEQARHGWLEVEARAGELGFNAQTGELSAR